MKDADFPELDGPTISSNRRLPPDYVVLDSSQQLAASDAKIKARRAFQRGLVCGIVSAVTGAAFGIWLLMVLA